MNEERRPRARRRFISGLPRSGSTLLSAVLRQNPRFHAGVTSPVAMLCTNLLQSMGGGGEFAPFFTDRRRKDIVQAVVRAYYADAPADSVILDTNRTWSGKTALLAELYPDARIICCVRNVSWVLDSIERLIRRNALQPSKIFNYKTSGSVYSRVEMLMDPEKGLVGLPWTSMREAWFGERATRLVVIRYESLTRDPHLTFARLYDALGERMFCHDFDNVAFDAARYDQHLGTPDLHKIRSKVAHTERETCLPPDIVAKYSAVNFWDQPALNKRDVVVI